MTAPAFPSLLGGEVPAPGARKLSLADRVLDRLFPLAPEYEGILPVESQRAAQRRALSQASLGLLANAGSGRGTFANVGAAVRDVNFPAQLEGMAGTIAAVRDRQAMIERERKRAEIVGQFPAVPGETLQQTGERLTRMLPAFVEIGDLETVGKLTELLKSLQLGQRGEESFKIVDMDNPVTGRVHRYRVFADGTPEDLGPAAPAGSSSLNDQRLFNRENALRDDFNREIEPIRDARAFIDQALKSTDLARDGDGAAQVQLLYAFVKAMDPTSVVREGEVALARQAQGIYQKAGAFLRQFESGAAIVVPPGLVDQMTRLLEQRVGSYDRQWRAIRDRFVQDARRWGVSPSTFQAVPGSGNPTPPAGNGSARGQLDSEYGRKP